MAKLILSSGEIFELNTPICIIGNEENCQIKIPDFSGNSVQIKQIQNGFCLIVLGNTTTAPNKNNTLLNGSLLNTNTHYQLKNNDEISFGEIKVLFQEENNSTSKSREITISNNTYKYASFGERLIAYLIDSFISFVPIAGIGIIIFIINYSYSKNSEIPGDTIVTGLLLSIFPCFIFCSLGGFVLEWLYKAYLTSSPKGGTWGKQIMNIKVTDLQGNNISFKRATSRFLGSIISNSTLIFFAIAYLCCLFNEKKQTLHDLMAETIVVKSK